MTGDVGYHSALASKSRRQVLDALVDSPHPLDAQSVADALGVHVTTARFHLDQLAAAGLARRRPNAVKRRGRPRMLFSAAGRVRDEDAREQLIDVLATALARDDDGASEALRAGRRWARAFEPLNIVDPTAGLIDVLDRLGFAPERAQDVIRLHACPFRDAARQHPEVVCSVHEGLIRALVDGSGAPDGIDLLPFVEPELCLVRLGDRRAADG